MFNTRVFVVFRWLFPDAAIRRLAVKFQNLKRFKDRMRVFAVSPVSRRHVVNKSSASRPFVVAMSS